MENKEIVEGVSFELSFSFNQDDVELFSEATGDKNPIHLDSSFAEKTIFKRPIIHGFLAGSVFSKIFGTIFPGQGTICLKQSMTFIKPMYVNVNYTAVLTPINIDKKKESSYC
jgi:3-hydroxybutyryl-CoA dehydratase